MATRYETDLVVHPGEFLLEELESRGMSQAALARATERGAETINRICRGRLGISADMAISLEEALGIRASSWLNLQTTYELGRARQERARRAAARAGDETGSKRRRGARVAEDPPQWKGRRRR